MEKDRSYESKRPNSIIFDFSISCIQKIALANSRERADELAKDLNGYVWVVDEILDVSEEATPVYLIISGK